MSAQLSQVEKKMGLKKKLNTNAVKTFPGVENGDGSAQRLIQKSELVARCTLWFKRNNSFQIVIIRWTMTIMKVYTGKKIWIFFE